MKTGNENRFRTAFQAAAGAAVAAASGLTPLRQRAGLRLFAALFLSCCINSPLGGGAFHQFSIRPAAEREKDKEERRARKRRDVKAAYYAKGNEEACGEDRRCRDACGDLFDDDVGAMDDCLEFRVDIVEYMEDIFQIIESPTSGELSRIDHKIFSAALSLSLEPWTDALKRVSAKEAEIILSWIAKDSDIAESVYEFGSEGGGYQHQSYAGLKEILKTIGPRAEAEDKTCPSGASASGGASSGVNIEDCKSYRGAMKHDLSGNGFSFCEIGDREDNLYTALIAADLREGFCIDCWGSHSPCGSGIAQKVERALESASNEELAALSPSDLRAYFRLEGKSINKLAHKLSQTIRGQEARRILLWIALNPEIAAVLREEDDDNRNDPFYFFRCVFGVLEDKNPRGCDDSDKLAALSKSLNNGRSFMENIIGSNGDALEYVYDFFHWRGGMASLSVFNNYCSLERHLRADFARLLRTDDFADLVNDILEDHQPNDPANEWRSQSRRGENYPPWWETRPQCIYRCASARDDCGDACEGRYAGSGATCDGNYDDCVGNSNTGCSGLETACKAESGCDSACQTGCTEAATTCRTACQTTRSACIASVTTCEGACEREEEQCLAPSRCFDAEASKLNANQLNWMCRLCNIKTGHANCNS